MFDQIRKYKQTSVGVSFLATLILICVILAGQASPETVAQFDTTRFVLIDSLTTSGVLARPQICPVDSNWIAYEIHQVETVQLILRNLVTGERRHIAPGSSAKPADSIGHSITSMNQDLSWKPNSASDGIWAAYVNDSSGIHRIYLYEVRTGRSYCLASPDTSDEVSDYAVWGTPAWSPDGKCLAYAAAINGDADIFVIRGMDFILENPQDVDVNRWRIPLISDEGNQFSPAWCPTYGAGYIVYTEQDKDNSRLRIKLFDPLPDKTYPLSGFDTTVNYFAPAWNDGGNRIAFYRHDIDNGPFSRFSGPDNEKWEVGLAAVRVFQETIVLALLPEGKPDSAGMAEVVPNFDRLMGPAWLPGGRHLAVTAYDEIRPSRLRIIFTTEWENDRTEFDYWLRGFGGDHFDFPRDLNIVNRNIAFTFVKDTARYLMTAQLMPDINLVLTPELLEVTENRRFWWNDYASGRISEAGFIEKVGHFLWSPIVGPDIGINKGIVPVLGGLVLFIAAVGGDDDDTDAKPPRDWTPPEFPNPGKKRPGFKITMGF